MAGLLHALLFILGGLIFARWTWIFLTPDTAELPSKMEQATTTQLTTLLDAHWFTPAIGSIVAAPLVNFKLVGIYSSSNDKPGFAVFNLVNGKQRAVLLHQEITAGIYLLTIRPDVVQVGKEGDMQTLNLESSSLLKPIPKQPSAVSK